MANRQFQQFQGTLRKGMVKLFARVAIAGTGACTLKHFDPKARTYSAAPTATNTANIYQTGEAGIKSITRTGTGAYTIKLQDTYNELVGVRYSISNADGKLTPVCMGILDATDVATLATGIQVQFNSATTSAVVDPASGDTILFEITLINSSAV